MACSDEEQLSFIGCQVDELQRCLLHFLISLDDNGFEIAFSLGGSGNGNVALVDEFDQILDHLGSHHLHPDGEGASLLLLEGGDLGFEFLLEFSDSGGLGHGFSQQVFGDTVESLQLIDEWDNVVLEVALGP